MLSNAFLLPSSTFKVIYLLWKTTERQSTVCSCFIFLVFYASKVWRYFSLQFSWDISSFIWSLHRCKTVDQLLIWLQILKLFDFLFKSIKAAKSLCVSTRKEHMMKQWAEVLYWGSGKYLSNMTSGGSAEKVRNNVGCRSFLTNQPHLHKYASVSGR